jgi:hypothetical protein
MKCFPKSFRQQWLDENGVGQTLQSRLGVRDWDICLALPQNLHKQIAFLENSLGDDLGKVGLLVSIEDWPLYLKTEFETVKALRLSWGEERRLIDAPEHVFDANETEIALGLFALTIGFGWSATLISTGPTFIAHNWEGEYLDCWCASAEKQRSLELLAERFEIQFERRKGN